MLLSALGLLLLAACAPVMPEVQLSDHCSETISTVAAVNNHWLAQEDIWRLRQTALLEIRGRKIPLEGFMLLDLRSQRLHLVAMNEMGIVFFELLVTETEQELQRALAQLQEQPGLAEGIATSLRRIYLQPRPQPGDAYRQQSSYLRAWRFVPGGELNFIFDCSGRLRETRQTTDATRWRVQYQDYRIIEGRELPETIVMNDFQQGVTLTLRQSEVRLAP